MATKSVVEEDLGGRRACPDRRAAKAAVASPESLEALSRALYFVVALEHGICYTGHWQLFSGVLKHEQSEEAREYSRTQRLHADGWLRHPPVKRPALAVKDFISSR